MKIFVQIIIYGWLLILILLKNISKKKIFFIKEINFIINNYYIL